MVLVFSLENEASFQDVYQLYSQLNTHRSSADIPIVVVGTQGKEHGGMKMDGYVQGNVRGQMDSICRTISLILYN